MDVPCNTTSNVMFAFRTYGGYFRVDPEKKQGGCFHQDPPLGVTLVHTHYVRRSVHRARGVVYLVIFMRVAFIILSNVTLYVTYSMYAYVRVLASHRICTYTYTRATHRMGRSSSSSVSYRRTMHVQMCIATT